LTPSLAQHDPAHSSVDPHAGPPSEPVRVSGENAGSGFPGSSIPDGGSTENASLGSIGTSSTGNSSTGDAALGEDELPPDLESSDGDGARRTIKRYSNRKLYDTRQSRYVTLLQIAEMVRAGEDVQIIDNATKEDKTDVTLALIIS
jgi:hypothetical protein